MPTATAFCDCCSAEVPRDQIATVTAYGIETAACCACRGVEVDDEPDANVERDGRC